VNYREQGRPSDTDEEDRSVSDEHEDDTTPREPDDVSIEPRTMRFPGVPGTEVEHGEARARLTSEDRATIGALRPGTALLIVQRGPNAGARFLLDDDQVTAGRHPDSDIFLDDVTVSRKHATFAREGKGYVVRDSGSLNGTYVNRERIDEVVLSTGDEVQIGKFRLVYYAD
jgi:pSer/pThr/pTyr-binding forkhead associated (FHA) protein